jgi:uncharacterized protein involved in exopolysaccharide biosynthesis
LWVIFTIFALTVLSGYYVTNEVLPKVYSAASQIEIRPRGVVDVDTIGSGATEKNLNPSEFQAEFTIMQSPAVLLPIIKELQLDKIWAKREFKSSLDSLPDQDALAYMNSILKLDFKRGTNIIEITVASEVPTECRDIANAIADRYKTMRDVEEDQRTNRGVDQIRAQISDQQKVVDTQRALVEKMRQDLGSQGVTFSNDNGTGGVSNKLETELDDRKHDLPRRTTIPVASCSKVSSSSRTINFSARWTGSVARKRTLEFCGQLFYRKIATSRIC